MIKRLTDFMFEFQIHLTLLDESFTWLKLDYNLTSDFKFYIVPPRYCFPFGRPEGALKATLSLLERVLMKDIVTPVPPEEVRSTIKKSLENAALDNYTRLSAEAKIEGTSVDSCWFT